MWVVELSGVRPSFLTRCFPFLFWATHNKQRLSQPCSIGDALGPSASAQLQLRNTEVPPDNSAMSCSGRRSQHGDNRRRSHRRRGHGRPEAVFGMCHETTSPHVWLATHGRETTGQCGRTRAWRHAHGPESAVERFRARTRLSCSIGDPEGDWKLGKVREK